MSSSEDSSSEMYRVGVLAIQGAFAEHTRMLTKAAAQLGQEARIVVIEVRRCDQLSGLAGLIIPGGESTTMSLFLGQNGFGNALKSWIENERGKGVVWGTCAGLILLSNELKEQKSGGQALIGGLDVTTSRNSFGRQVDSFETKLILKEPGLHSNKSEVAMGSHAPLTTSQCTVHPDEYYGIFIRAPKITSVDSPQVKVLAELDGEGRNEAVAVQQGNIMATSFHPELTNDTRWHRYFLKMCINQL